VTVNGFSTGSIMKTAGFLLAFLCSSISFLISFPVVATTRYVDASAPSGGDGSSWKRALQSIQSGIDEASDGDTVVVARGRYLESVDFKGKGITLTSTSPTNPEVVRDTIIDAKGAGSAITIQSGGWEQTVLRGFTITGGHTQFADPFERGGGGIHCDGVSPTIEYNVIIGNLAGECGGGLYCRESGAVVRHNTFEGNDAQMEGAAIWCDNCWATITDNTVVCNGSKGMTPSALYVDDSTGTISRNIIKDNFGMGLACWESDTVITDNVITGNGGGVSCFRGSPTIRGNIIAKNFTLRRGAGGGIRCTGSSGSPLVGNNTIAYNYAPLGAGGIYCEDSSPTILNCILWGNGGDLIGCTATYSCIEDGDEGEGNISSYPHFVDPKGDDFHLLTWSPCIDKGDPAEEHSNEPMPNGGRINMGAYGNTPEAASASPDTDADTFPDDWELLHFKNLDQDAAGDADSDTLSNADEFRYGTDPAKGGKRVENITSGLVYPSINPALSQAADGDEIVVEPGRYLENVDFFGKAVTLRSTNPTDEAIVAATIIDGNGAGSVICFKNDEGADSVLRGFTVTGGKMDHGGGIYCKRSSPTITENIIMNNTAILNGGAILCGGGSPTITGNTIIFNNAGAGGGISLGEVAGSVIGNVIISNSAESGGGISIGNWASTTFTNNVIARNSASTVGGAFYCWHKEFEIVNCTIVDNHGGQGGGGIWCQVGMSPPLVSNCILWGNGEDMNAGRPRYSCIEHGPAGEGSFCHVPRFLDREGGNYHLSAWSPCIDAGDPASPFDDEPAPNGGRVNMGAYGNTPEAATRWTDSDSDLLPDDWEVATFGDSGQTGGGDYDGDGILNLDEFHYGWAASVATEAPVQNVAQGTFFAEIQPAICESADGDEIVLQPGTYRETINFMGRAIELRSSGSNGGPVEETVVIDAEGSAPVVTFCSGESPSAILRGLTLTGGRASQGGGVRCVNGSSPTIIRCIIRGNEATEQGGGVFCHGSSPRFENCTIKENAAVSRPTCELHWSLGGGFFLENSEAVLRNCLIADNSAVFWGRGIHCIGDACRPEIVNCTIAQNTTSCELKHFHEEQATVGIYAFDGATPTIVNCIIWGHDDEIFGCTTVYSCNEDQEPEDLEGEGNIHVDPQFVNPLLGDYHLLTTSPCVDAGLGDHPNLPESDLDGEARPSGGGIDMGADEISDSDLDSLPDVWEMRVFGKLDYGPDDDPDADNLSNIEEFALKTNPTSRDTDGDGSDDAFEVAAGTSPLDPLSVFGVVSIEMVPGGTQLKWATVPGRQYRIHFSDDLSSWLLAGYVYTAEGQSLDVLDNTASSAIRRLYRVEVLP